MERLAGQPRDLYELAAQAEIRIASPTEETSQPSPAAQAITTS
jgi:hypothetical protein